MAATLARKPPVMLSAERKQLAEAIEAAGAEQSRRDALTAAYQAATAKVYALNRAAEAAEEAVAHAPRAHAEYFVRQALGQAADAPVTLATAHTDLADLQAERNAALAARDDLAGQIEAAASAPWLKDRVKTAAFAVIRAEAADYTRHVAAEVEQLQVKLLFLTRSLEWLTQTPQTLPVESQPGVSYRRVTDSRIGTIVTHMNNRPDQWFQLLDLPESQGAKPWQAALADLMVDPTAPLPLTD